MASFRINTVTVNGNLTRDPELRNTAGGEPVCSLRIAHSERFKRNGEWEDRANFFDVTVWGGVGEWVASNLAKGDQVVVQGALKWREWEARDGQKRQSVDINAFGIVPVPRDGGGRSSGGSDFRARDEAAPPRDEDFSAPVGAGEFKAQPAEDDIPF